MSSQIDANSSNTSDSTINYYMNQISPVIKDVMQDVLMGKLFFSTLRAVWEQISPSAWYNDELDDVEGQDFTVTSDHTKNVIKKFIDNCVTFAEDVPQETKDALSTHLEAALIKRKETISEIAKKMGITRHVEYAISTGSSLGSYASAGDRFSLHDPLIISYSQKLHITNEAGVEQAILQQSEEAKKEFIIAHELAHIARGDHLCRTISLVGMMALNMGLWSYGMGLAAPLITRVVTTLAFTLCTHSISKMFYHTLCRHQERQADLLAMDTLGSSEGAIAFFSSQTDNPQDLEHPSISERLATATAWKKAQ